MTTGNGWRDFLRLEVFVRPYAGRLAAIVAIGLVGSLLGLAQPYLSKYLVDNALLRRDPQALYVAAGLMFAATVLGFALSYVSGRGYVRLSAAMLMDMRCAVYSHLHQLSPRFYGRARLGDLVSRLNGDVAEVQRISADFFLTILGNVLFIIGSVAMMLWLSWTLFVVGIVLIPFCVLLFQRFQARLQLLARRLREQSAEIGTLFVETLLGVRLVACFDASDLEMQRFKVRNDSYVDTLLQFQSTSMLGRTLPGTLLTAATTAVFVYGGAQIIRGEMTIGTLVAFMAYHGRLLSPIQNLFGLSASLTSAQVSLARVLELLDAPLEVTEAADARPVSAIRQRIAFRHVTVRHDGRAVLDDVSFDLPAGRFSVIVGPSGGGKSTIADLMVRLIEPDDGAVLVDGVDLRRLQLRGLRRHIMLIDQLPYLFHGTLFENIAYGRHNVGLPQVEAAADAAGLTDLIKRLPEGFATMTGERGVTLSAGERQRVAIARAFLYQPDVLILDEPSAALDGAREREMVESLRRHFAGRTLIAITHRPALAAAADHLIHIEAGRVSECAWSA